MHQDYYKNNSHDKTQEFIKELNERKRNLITNSLSLILSTGDKLKSELIKVS